MFQGFADKPNKLKLMKSNTLKFKSFFGLDPSEWIHISNKINVDIESKADNIQMRYLREIFCCVLIKEETKGERDGAAAAVEKIGNIITTSKGKKII